MSRDSELSTVYHPKTAIVIVSVIALCIIIVTVIILASYISNPSHPRIGQINLPILSNYHPLEIPTPILKTPTPTVGLNPTIAPEKLEELISELQKLNAPQEVLDEVRAANRQTEE
ncbi:hypothetical protein COY32_00380 [candidate division WWE3 bacterium CG_4_10_14_0_2_um_filter_41_14]|uniref:Uncharacterized protein n=1 Tax=candidate division WWE3 bacterium CG_4_10_14_0_2_um_filter_41_14 TaxID=1975072 RepID=A0A2M7TM22_UNCKA|nr:MAG: hypothetical protein COY32_00380 [candidate division WWE3 bacterium CG_4_10_14_0_2_um_filter_41_14]